MLKFLFLYFLNTPDRSLRKARIFICRFRTVIGKSCENGFKGLAECVTNAHAQVFVRLSLEEQKRLEGTNCKCFSACQYILRP